AEPAERIDARELASRARRNRRTRDAVEAVAAGDEVAAELLQPPAVVEAHLGLARVEVVERRVLHLEEDLAARGEPRGDEVLDRLVLRVDHDGAAAGEAREVHAMTAAGEAQVDPLVHEALALHAFADAGCFQQVYRALLQHAGADRGFDLLPGARLDDH